MKIYAISDTHGHLPDVPPCDVLVIAGDVVPLSLQRSMLGSIWWLNTTFIDWIDSINCKKAILIAGNHDFVFDTQWGDFNKDELKKSKKLVYLAQNESYEYGGKTFYSFPWTPVLRGWAFYADNDKIKSECKKIPQKIDVLISHCPPKIGTAGVVMQNHYNHGRDFGCPELAEAINSRDIKCCICGHIHTGDKTPQIAENDSKTVVYNVSVLDENYKQYYNGTTIEI